jgi:hypothetical protein
MELETCWHLLTKPVNLLTKLNLKRLMEQRPFGIFCFEFIMNR